MNETKWLLHIRPIVFFSFNLKSENDSLSPRSDLVQKKKNSPQSDYFSYYVHSIQIFFTTDQFELKADEILDSGILFKSSQLHLPIVKPKTLDSPASQKLVSQLI